MPATQLSHPSRSRSAFGQGPGLRAVFLALLAASGALAACSESGGGPTPPRSDTAAPSGDITQPANCLAPDAPACTAPTPFCAASGACVECADPSHCPGSASCIANACTGATCTPGDTLCDGDAIATCAVDGLSWVTSPCPVGTCEDGACVGCMPGERACDGLDVLQCLPDGSGTQVVTTCPAERTCFEGGCVDCLPDTRRCSPAGLVETCAADGGWDVTADCASAGQVCQAGSCVDPCSRDPKSRSNAGCDYWAVDLDNHWDAKDSPFALIVSNLGTVAATVSVTRRDGPAVDPVNVVQRTVAPGALAIIELPNRNIPGAGVYWSAYKVDSTAPIVAYQFNPLDNVDVFSNDATILLPSNTFGTEYIVMSRFEFLGEGQSRALPVPYRGTVTIVAGSSGTDVSITPTARTLAGASMATMMPGQTYTYALEPFQVLNIKSDQDKGDLTGSLITATRPVGVFGGHEAAVSGQNCCADHLEHQLFPVSTWGLTYVASRSEPRGIESDYWRIVAAEDGTTVTFAPSDVQNSRTLARGEWFEFASRRDFVVTADKPVLVGQVLASSAEIVSPPAYSDCELTGICAPNYICDVGPAFSWRCFPPRCTTDGSNAGCPPGHVCHCFSSGDCGCAPVGDPSLILLPPVEQFRNEYVFLSPNQYARDYINVVAPEAAAVTLDAQPIAPGAWISVAGGWKVARVEVSDGVHKVVSNQNVGVIAYGYDKDVSYGYAAGLNLVDR